MPYSPSSPVRKCQGTCKQRKPADEFDSPKAQVCRACKAASKDAREEARKPPAPVPLGDGRTAIPLTGKHAHGRVALVSDAKVPRVAGFRWRVMEWTRPDGVKIGPYAVVRQGNRMIYMHALITGYARTDHKNGNGLDNTDENLRDCTQSQNGANRGKNRTAKASDYKGVRQIPSTGRWRARIKVNYEERHLGVFATQEEAVRARDAAAIEAWREFARPNLPVEDSEEMGTDD